jgi:MFS family permease
MGLFLGKLGPTVCILVSIFVPAMDISIMSTVMPTVVGELGGLALYSWSFSGYLLTYTTSMPIYGKLSDVYGRKPLFMVGMGLFLGASLLCGFATSMEQLIVCRALQGLGAGGVLPMTMTIAGDLFPLEQRARIEGLMSGVWGVAAIVGPLVGTLVVAHTTWRWVFWLNVPLGLVTIVVLQALFHERVVRRQHVVDYLGTALFAGGILALLLALVEAGEIGFGTPRVIGLLALAGALLAACAWVETHVAEPVIPLQLLRRRVLGLTGLASFVAGAVVYSSSTYLPLFVQGVQAGAAREVGLVVGAIAIAWTAGSVVGGAVLLRIGMRTAALLGMGLVVVSGILLVLLAPDRPPAYLLTAAVALGAGLGMATTTFVVVVQSAVGWDERGAATAALQFCSSIGGTLWVSVQGAALVAGAAATLAVHGIGDEPAGGRLGNLRAALTQDVRGAQALGESQVLAEALNVGLHQVFVLLLAIAVAGLAIVAALPSGCLPDRRDGSPVAVSP